MHSTVIAVDLAKDVFELAIADRHGCLLENQRLTRAQFSRFIVLFDGASRLDNALIEGNSQSDHQS